MGLGERAYNLLRAYIGREWERIEKITSKDARKELDDYLEHRTLATPKEELPAKVEDKIAHDRIAEAYKVLGLSRDATLHEMKRAYARLSERSLPTNFPEGSEERKQAAQIHLRVQEAYDMLLPILDPRLKRFQSLDLN